MSNEFATLGINVDVSAAAKAEQKLLQLVDVLEKLVDSNSDLARSFSDLKGRFDKIGDSSDSAKRGVAAANDEIKKTAAAGRSASSGLGVLKQAFSEIENAIPGLSRVTQVVGSIGISASGTGASLLGLAAAGGAVAGISAGLTALTGVMGAIGAISFASTINEIDALAKQTGRTVTETAILQKFLQSSGLDLSNYEDSLRDVQKALAKTGDAASEESQAFELFGVKVTDSTTAEQAAYDVSAKYLDLKKRGILTSEQAAAAMSLIGDNADEAALANMRAADAEKFRQDMFMRGLGITDQSVQASNDYKDAQNKASAAMQSMGSLLVQDVLPSITDLIDSFVKSYTEGGFVSEVFTVIRYASAGVVYGVTMISIALEGLWGVLKVVRTGFTGLMEAFSLAVTGDFSGAWNAVKRSGQDAANELKVLDEKMYAREQRANERLSKAGESGTVAGRSKTSSGKVVRGSPRATGQNTSSAKAQVVTEDQWSKAAQEYLDGISKSVKTIDDYVKSLNAAKWASQEAYQEYINWAELPDMKLSDLKQVIALEQKYQDEIRKSGEIARRAASERGLKEGTAAYSDFVREKERELEIETLSRLHADANLAAVEKLTTELEKQTRIGQQIGQGESSRLALVSELDRILATVTESEREQLKAIRNRIIAQHDQNKSQQFSANLAREQLALETQRVSAVKELAKQMGLTIGKSGAIKPVYQTAIEREIIDGRRQITAPAREKLIAAEVEMSKLEKRSGPLTEDEAIRYQELRKEIKMLNLEYLESSQAVFELVIAQQELNSSWAHGAMQGVIGVLDRMPTQAQAAASMIDTMSTALEDGLMKTFETGKFNAEEFFKTLLQQIAKTIIQMQVLVPLMNSLRAAMDSGIGNPIAKVSSTFSLAGSGVRFGPNYNGGIIERYASGGVVNTLSSFSTRTGLASMSEKNPEAIMPLKRNSRGQLGVLQTGSSQAAVINYSPSISIAVQGSDRPDLPAKIAQETARQTEQTFYALMAREKRPGGLLAR